MIRNSFKLIRSIKRVKKNIRFIMSMENGKIDTREHVDKIVHLDNPRAINYASSLLRNNHVIALPTDTVYGLACSGNNPHAIQRLYSIKGREKIKPIAICVANIESLRLWGQASHLQDGLLNSLLPGPVTIVLRKTKNLDNPYLNPGVEKIGIRIPDFPFIQELCSNFDFPIALTSANRSNEKSTLNIYEFSELWQQLEAIFDGGQLGTTDARRSASTVIDLSIPRRYKIIREGVAISKTVEIMKKYNIVSDV